MQRSVEDWLSLLEQRHPTEIELGLGRIAAVASRMGISPGHARVITVAGTNGKGSTCAMIDALLTAHGLRTGRYASPHLLTFHERITLTGTAINDEQLLAAFAAVEAGRGDVSLTFFEFTTLAAFWSFQQAKLDVWVVEVGLGGRLDATNILDADVGVVTSIALDHQDWLGDDVVQIGREKAGIFRPQRLAVLGQPDGCEGVVEVAQKLGIRLLRRGRDFGLTKGTHYWHWNGVIINSQGDELSIRMEQLTVPQLPLVNASTALQAVLLLFPDIGRQAASQAFAQVRLMGRMQSYQFGEADCVVDVGHNPQAAQYMADQLRERQWQPDAVILGMLSDKDVTQTASLLLTLMPKTLFLASLSVPRGRSASQLESLIKTDVPIVTCESIAAAIEQARQHHKKLLICGSFYTVANAIHHFQDAD